MKVELLSINCSYIHTALATRWLYVAKDKQHDVKVRDYSIKDSIQKIVNDMCQSQPEVIGLSVYIWNADIMKELIVELAQVLPKCRLICGGPEVSYQCDEFLKLPIEAVIRGEGEIAFWQVVNGNTDVDGYVSLTKVSKNTYAKVDLKYLETLESPFFLEFDRQSQKNKYLYLETSRGCPYNCSYCLSSLEKGIRMFSLNYVKKQLKQLETIPCKQVKFLDRTFNIDAARALEIAQYIEQLNVTVSFEFEVMVEYLSEELLNFFEHCRPNRYRFEVGVQSFNQKTLRSVNRFQNSAKLKTNIKRLKGRGNIVHTDLIAGLPYEDYASFKASFQELYGLKSTEMQIGILKLLKGTKLAADKDKYGIEVTTKTPYVTYKTNWLSEKDLIKITYLYHATEKVHNNPRLKYTLDYLYDDQQDVFEILTSLGEKIDNFSQNIQIKNYFLFMYEILQKQTNYNDLKIKSLLMMDYYRLFKVRPTNIFQLQVSRPIKQMLFKQMTYSLNYLENYAIVTWGYLKDKAIYQVVVYSRENKKPEIFWFDLNLRMLAQIQPNTHSY